MIIKCHLKFSFHDKYKSLEQCTATVVITSSGLASAHHSAKLGTYSEDGISNGRIAYKNGQGHYLYFNTNSNWMVSKK